MNKFKLIYMNAAELFDTTIDVYKKSFFEQLAVSIIMGIISSIVMMLVVGLFFIFGFISMFNLINMDTMPPGFIALIIAAAVVFIILSSILNSVKFTASMEIVRQVFSNQKINITKSLSTAFKSAFQICATALAHTIAFLPSLIILIGLYVLMFIGLVSGDVENYFYSLALSDNYVFPVLITLLLVIFILLLFIPLSVLLSLAIPVTLFEKICFFKALKKSIQLVKPDFLKITGMSMVFGLSLIAIYYSITMIFQLPFILIGIMGEFVAFNYESILLLGQSSSWIFSTVASLIFAPLSTIFTTMIYLNQKMKYEGLDIEIGLQNLKGE